MTILADIGGTHARFALSDERGALQNIEKYAAADFSDFATALDSYCANNGVPQGGPIAIATAAQPCEDGVYRFTNNNKWQIIPSALVQVGWQVKLVVSDFKALARGAAALDETGTVQMKAGAAKPGQPIAVIGPGTGLGLAYATVLDDGHIHIQRTYGGHMLAAAATDEQFTIMKLVRRLLPEMRTVVYEDMASGRALPLLYKAVCLYSGRPPQDMEAEDLLAQVKDAGPEMETTAQQTLRLFHEFLGLFAHAAVVTGNAFGGVYLDGGVFQKLREAGLFDFPRFEKFMVLNPVPIVKEALEKVPVYAITDPYVTLRGLQEMLKDE